MPAAVQTILDSASKSSGSSHSAFRRSVAYRPQSFVLRWPSRKTPTRCWSSTPIGRPPPRSPHCSNTVGSGASSWWTCLTSTTYPRCEQIALPPGPVYLVSALDRGDHMANWSPEEALPAITAAGRTPLTVAEGIHWLLQQPDILARGHCFMTIGSRLRKPNGSLDARTPALWISNGTGRDGQDNRNAPKLGWCWAGNRHTWLGFASASRHASRQRAEPARIDHL